MERPGTRGLGLVGAAVLLAVLVSGCNGEDASNGQTPAPPVPGKAETPATPPAAETPLAARPRTAYEDLPGIPELTKLTEEQQAEVLQRANTDMCDCGGCVQDTVARCLTLDPVCTVAPELARQIIRDVVGGGAQTRPAEETG